MKNNERLVQFFDVSIFGRTRAKGIDHKLFSPKNINDLMADFESLRELNEARKKVKGESKLEYRLEDMQSHPDYWVLLINVVDTTAAHPVTNIIGGSDDDREIVELGDGRGLESSTHIIINKTPDAAGKHLVLYEYNINVAFSRTAAFLAFLCRKAAKLFPDDYIKPHPDGVDGKTINVFCGLMFLGHPSDEFFEELENGILTDIRLTSDVKTLKGYDAQAHKELVSTEIKMSVSKVSVLLSGGNNGHLSKAIQYAKSLDAPFVRVQFNDSTKTGHTALLSSDTGNLWNADRYVKKRRIKGFGNSLRTAFPVINDGIREKMLALIQQQE